MSTEFVRVAAIAPFWRYAVGPTSAQSPAIPYYTLIGATACFEEAKRDLPWAGVMLYKRRLRGVEVIREYTPKPGLGYTLYDVPVRDHLVNPQESQ